MAEVEGSDTDTLAVLKRQLSNSASPPLTRALAAYRRLDLTGPCRKRPTRTPLQRQKRLNHVELDRLVTGYRAGATVYDLAAAFGIHRETVGLQLRAAGVTIRHQSPPASDVVKMARLYESGLSLARVAERTGYTVRTVHRYLRLRGISMRDSQGGDVS